MSEGRGAKGEGRRAWIVVALLGLAVSTAVAEDAKAIADKVLRQYDKDGNGRINEKECSDEMLFRKYDKNKDGVITRGEIEAEEDPAVAKAAARRRKAGGLNDFTEFDEDGNGELSAKEMAKFMFEQLDRDATGQLNGEELAAGYVPYKLRNGDNPLLQSLKKLDKNKNGVVDEDEWEVPRSYFDAFDRDSSNGISKDEVVLEQLEAMGGLPGFSGVDMFERRDKNHDKMLTNSEFEGGTDLFDRIDQDKDKLISIEEYNNYMDQIRSVMRNADDIVARFDLNGDAKVTRAEFPGSDNAFERADTNGDGVLSAADRTPRR